MFNLIITIIAIALVVVLTATSIYYGGSAFSNGSADALAATFINQAQQVQAAATLYSAQNGGSAADVQALLDGSFLKSNPQTPATQRWELESGIALTAANIGASNGGSSITPEVCNKINEKGSSLVRCVAVAVADIAAPTDVEATAAAAATVATVDDAATTVVVYTAL